MENPLINDYFAIKSLIQLVNKKKKNSTTKGLIRGLNQKGIDIPDERSFRFLIAETNSKLELFGMRLKWIPYPEITPDRDRWILAGENTKPAWINAKMLKCLACGIIFSSRNKNGLFSLEQLIQAIPTLTEKQIQKITKKLVKEHYFVLTKDQRFRIGERTIREINLSHFLAALAEQF